ncbi:hypothetical protein [Spirosoma arboris]|nr:hypothetical protein [Spirosoma arboris]
MKKKAVRPKVSTIVVSSPVAGIWDAIAKSIAESYNLPTKKPTS